MGRRFYEFVVPYWEQVAAGTAPPIPGVVDTPARQEFAEIQGGLTKVVFSQSLGDDPDTKRVVISGDIGAQLAAMKAQPGKDIILSSGPGTLAEVAREPGLIDDYLVVIHSAVITAGPRLFEQFEKDLAFDLVHAEVFAGGAIIARYRDRAASWHLAGRPST
jgi:dihydrofolate reductase